MKNSPTIYLLLILLLAFVVRLGGAVYWSQVAESENRLFRLGDSHSYWVLAGQIARGLPYEYGSSESKIFRAPLYPLCIAPLTLLPNEAKAVAWTRVLGSFYGTLAVALLALLSWRLGGWCAALWAATLGAIYPSAVGMSIVILSEAIFLPLMLTYVLLWQAAWQATDNKHVGMYATLAGIIAGAAVLARPSWLLFPPFVAVVGLFIGGQRTRHATIFFYSLLGLSLMMSPWWVRNARITGHFVPTTLQVGPSLYDGLHEGASGASDEDMAFMRNFFAEQKIEDQQKPAEQLSSTFEYRVNARAQAAAIDWVRSQPLKALHLALRKFLRTWTLWPDGGDIGSPIVRLAITISSFSVISLAIHASWQKMGSSDWFWAICWLPCLYFTLLHMVFVGSVRYREPAIFLLIALAGCTLGGLSGCRIAPNTAGTTRPQLERVNHSGSVSRT